MRNGHTLARWDGPTMHVHVMPMFYGGRVRVPASVRWVLRFIARVCFVLRLGQRQLSCRVVARGTVHIVCDVTLWVWRRSCTPRLLGSGRGSSWGVTVCGDTRAPHEPSGGDAPHAMTPPLPLRLLECY